MILRIKIIVIIVVFYGIAQQVLSQNQVSRYTDFARIAIELGEYDQALAYIDSIPTKAYNSTIKQMRQVCVDTIGNRLYGNARRYFTNLQFKEALFDISKIPNGYFDAKKVDALKTTCSNLFDLQGKGKVLNKWLAESVSGCKDLGSFRNHLAPITKADKSGYVTKNGIIRGNFYSNEYNPYISSEGVCVYGNPYYPYLVDSTGCEINLPRNIEYCGDFRNGFAGVRTNKNKWGFIDKKGKIVIPCKFDNYNSIWPTSLYDFYDGMALVAKKNGYCFINTSGKIIIDDFYTKAYCHFSEGLAWIYGKELLELRAINHEGKVKFSVTIPNYDEIYIGNFHCGIARLTIKDWKGKMISAFITNDGTYLTGFVYDMASNFSESYAAVEKDGKWGFIDKEGTLRVPLEYSKVKDFKEGLAPVCMDNKWGYVDYNGKLVIPCIYDYAANFSEDFAVVKKDGKMGYVDKYGFCTINYIAKE